MKVVVAPDAFKGSLTQIEAASIMKNAIREIIPLSEVVMKPMADGGEGTLEALLAASAQSKRMKVTVAGPLGKKVEIVIGIINQDTAVIEIAEIAGLTMISEDNRNPEKTTTYGIGEAIRIALDHDIRKFVVGLGGSSTNDGGFGMLAALGATLMTSEGKLSSFLGEEVMKINSIDLTTIDQRVKESTFQVASDVSNPLTGENGATLVFGPQKGIKHQHLNVWDEALKRYGELLDQAVNTPHPITTQSGAGAAGGLGVAFLAIGGNLISGAQLMAETIELETEIMEADLVVTGEGKSDDQTLYGKAPGYIAELAEKYRVPVYLVSGSLSDENHRLSKHFTEIHSIINPSITLQRAMEEAGMLLLCKMKNILRRNKFMVKEIHTEDAPAAIGPYSQGIQAGDFLYVSGQIGVDPKTGEVVEGIENQTNQVLENLQAILTKANTDFSQVVKFTIYLTSMDDFGLVNDLYGAYLHKPYPARATVEVSRLPKDVLVEMDVIVYTKD